MTLTRKSKRLQEKQDGSPTKKPKQEQKPPRQRQPTQRRSKTVTPSTSSTKQQASSLANQLSTKLANPHAKKRPEPARKEHLSDDDDLSTGTFDDDSSEDDRAPIVRRNTTPLEPLSGIMNIKDVTPPSNANGEFNLISILQTMQKNPVIATGDVKVSGLHSNTPDCKREKV